MNRKSDDDKTREREDEISFNYYIADLSEMLEYARIWPVKTFLLCKTPLSTGATAIFILLNFVLVVTEIAALWTISINSEMLANIIGSIPMHFVGFAKWCYCISKRREIFDILAMLERCDLLCQRIDNSEKGYRIYIYEMRRAQRYSRYFIRTWMYFVIRAILHWCANPMLMENWTNQYQMHSINDTIVITQDRSLPFLCWHPALDPNNNYNYFCLYLSQTIGVLASGLGFVCFDIFYVTMLIVVNSQFQYINTILTTDTDNVPEHILDKKLQNCVKCHIEIIKFLKQLQLFTTIPIFIQCIETMLIICALSITSSVIKIEMNKESILKLWSLILNFFGSCAQLFFFCFSATRVQSVALQIAHSVYSCGWEFERREQSNSEKQLKHHNTGQLVQLIMVQAQRPIILTGGPFYTLSLETFRAISVCLVWQFRIP